MTNPSAPTAGGRARARFDLEVIGRGLPVAERIRGLAEVLAGAAAGSQAGRAVMQAPPGTGKTTLVPPAVANLLAAGGSAPGKVLVTAPRRVAVRAAARHLAHLDGSRLGDRVGYSVRGEHHPGSLVEFVTPGVLLRRLLADPELADVGAVIVDEIHERQLDSDLVVGMVLELADLREDLLFLAMSATLDASALARHIGGGVLATPAVTHPLDVVYLPGGEAGGESGARSARLGPRGVERSFLDRAARVAAAGVEKHGHSALVFVPGVREVDHMVGELRRITDAPVLPLHGRLDAAEQDRALTPADRPRVVVATSIAESSLTVPGVRVVVDCGLARVPRWDAGRGMGGLLTISTTRASADQRAGRAGREGPGTVYRLYSQSEYQHFAPEVTPEIETSDLTQAALQIACWGTPRGAGLPLLTPPPEARILAAEDTLRSLGAVDEHGAATKAGTKLSRIPADPRLGRALLEGAGVVGARTAAEVVAVLADQPSGDISRATSRAPRQEVRRLERIAKTEAGSNPSQLRHRSDAAAYVAALAYPLQIARRTHPGEYLLASGTRASLPPGDSLFDAQWLAVAALQRAGSNAIIRAAARLGDAPAGPSGEAATSAADTASAIIGLTEEETAHLEGGKVRARRVRRIGAIELSRTTIPATPELARKALTAEFRRTGLGMFHLSDGARTLRQRMGFLHRVVGAPWPDVSDAALAERSAEWLAPEFDRAAGLGTGGAVPTSHIDLHDAFQRLLPWPAATRLAELAPERIELPSGRSQAVDYGADAPTVACKLQECFGWADSPRLGAEHPGGGVPVTFHLLSPAGRPLAVTDDLASFWSGAYAQVRSEMRGRYPKHPWPEDPWSAKATAKTKKRM